MPESLSTRTPQVVLAFDFGLRRIGCAVGDTLTRRARPLRTLERRDPTQLLPLEWSALTAIIREVGATQIVVGQPYNADGSRHALADALDAFVMQVGERCALPVHQVDERYSSLEAEETLRELRARGQRRGAIKKTDVDSMAAALILERWLAGAPA
ncbi:MAG: Holliday junction resolvase RuvX [Steroidobacteraceae bacterium]|jgi:putative Holliday junction resolvase